MKKFILPIVALCTVAFVACGGAKTEGEAAEAAEAPEVVEEVVVAEEPVCACEECACEECTGDCGQCTECAEEVVEEAVAE